ncbi:MAG: tetratricopeptide repeat protein [Treponema sp.]
MAYGKQNKRIKPLRYRNIHAAGFFVLVMLIIAAGFFFAHSYKKFDWPIHSMKSIYADWEDKNYMSVYEKTADFLNTHPFDGTALALHGFAAYYLFAEQTDLLLGSDYLSQAIAYLRCALYRIKASDLPKVSYVLGKAYYQQGYYYADLAVKYLDIAYEAGLKADDLSEFRGMAASLLGDTDKALAAFTETLALNPSDLVLYAVANNYYKKNDMQNAKLYLFETINKTSDAVLEVLCRNQLGFLLIKEKSIAEAFEQFNMVLKKDTGSADAHYGLGLLYEIQGDMVKARHEWRQAIKLNPLHHDAYAKLNIK